MSANFQLILPQSTTTDAQSPSPSTASPTAVRPSIKQEVNPRLDLYNSLFASGSNKICDETGLQLTQSLNYSLQTFLYTCDIYWILSMIDIHNFDNVQKKYGHSKSKRKIIQIGNVIEKFCQNDPRKLKGFRCNDLVVHDDDEDDAYTNADEDESQHDLFALLVYCHPHLNKSEKYISKLMKKIQQQTNERVCVGIAKMNEWETVKEWKHRAMKNLKNAKNRSETLETKETKTNNGTFYSDIGVNYVNPKLKEAGDEQEAKRKQQQGAVVQKFGNKEEFDAKMQEIANNEDFDWIVAVVSIDDFGAFFYSNNNNSEKISQEITRIEKEIYHLFDIYGNSMNKNEMKYFGYNLSNRGEFGVILYDSKNTNKCFIPAHELIETLKEEIAIKFNFTVSIGSSRLIDDDLGMSDDWYERVYNNLTQAKKNGGNQVSFGVVNDDNKNEDVELKIVIDGTTGDNDHESDAIQMKSLHTIKVCDLFFFFFGWM